jgi:membrane-associated protease RseP (regulator of RpoE activity)
MAIGGVLPGSAAEEAGLQRGDVVTAVNGQPIEGEEEFEAALAEADREVTVDRRDGEAVTVQRGLIVTRAVVDAPIDTGTTVRAVDGETVYTRSAFEETFSGSEVVELETDGGTVRLPIGVFVSTVPGEDPLGSAGAPDTPTIIHSVGGERTPTPEALSAALEGTDPGETVEVVAYHGEADDVDPWNGERHTYEVELGEHPREEYGYLGVGGIQRGTSGVVVDDFGIDTYPAERYHALLGGAGWGDDPVTTFVSRTFALLVLPFASVVDPNLGYNFAGFNGEIANFYAVSGPLSAGAVFALANVLFWTGWVNINLGLFNCIPSYPLDGGHILRSCVEATLVRLPVDATPLLASAVTTAISVTMILSLLGMLFAPQLL